MGHCYGGKICLGHVARHGNMANLSLSPPRRAGSERKASGGRARDLLRQHYGLGGIPAPSGKPNDPLDMGTVGQQLRAFDDSHRALADSPAFEATGYYDQMLATSTLPTLLKQHNSISEGAVSSRRRLRASINSPSTQKRYASLMVRFVGIS